MMNPEKPKFEKFQIKVACTGCKRSVSIDIPVRESRGFPLVPSALCDECLVKERG